LAKPTTIRQTPTCSSSVARSPSFAQLSSKSWLICAAQEFQTSLQPLPSSLLDSRRGLLEALHKQSRRLVSKM
jgi:hypothetical protein